MKVVKDSYISINFYFVENIQSPMKQTPIKYFKGELMCFRRSWNGGLVLIVYSWGQPPPFFPPYWYNFTSSNPAYFDIKHNSGLYFLHSFNQLNQIILITVLLFWTKVQNLFLLLGRDIEVIRTKASQPSIFRWKN